MEDSLTSVVYDNFLSCKYYNRFRYITGNLLATLCRLSVT